MSDENKSPPPSSDSSSDSPSPDALDSSSTKALTRWIEGVNHRLADILAAVQAGERKGAFREQMALDALKKNAAALDAIVARVDRSLKLNREVVKSQGQVVESAARRLDDSVRIVTQRPTESDKDEISAQHIKLRWSTLAKWAPWVLKAAMYAAGAFAAAYGVFKAFVQRFTD